MESAGSPSGFPIPSDSPIGPPEISHLFTPIRIGDLEVKNRFVHSATYEGLAKETGEVTDELVNRYRTLAKGEVGLIISSHLYVHPLGRTRRHQAGIDTDDKIAGLREIPRAVHQERGKVLFQLAHAGRQTSRDIIGRPPLGPSHVGRDPVKFVKPKEMNEGEIQEVILAFGQGARRASEAGADGVQLFAAHGYLINQFLSPFFNRRKDGWGGSDQNRFRFLKEVLLQVRQRLPRGMPILVKINAHDHTPGKGITPPLAAKYAGWLKDLGIDGLEVSCGSVFYSVMSTCRGDVPVREMVRALPWWEKPFAGVVLRSLAGKYRFQEAYNLEAARMIKAALGQIPLILVGGLRRVSQMEEIIDKGYADLISMSRPFIREPFLVKHIKEGADRVACVSCNRCLAAALNELPVRCYNKGFPAA